MAKCSNHYAKLKVVYFISTKDKSLTILVQSVQDFVVPLELSLQHFRADGDGEFIADYYHDFCKIVAIMQQFSSSNTPEHNGLSERDGRTIIDVARFMLIRATLPKLVGRKWRLPWCFYSTERRATPSATTRGTTECSEKRVDLFFLWATGTRPHEGRQAHLALTSWHTRYPHHLQSKQPLRAHWLHRHFIQHWQPGEGELYIREHVLFLWGPSTLAPASSATRRGLCSLRSREATAVEANTSRAGSWGCETGSWMRSSSSTTSRPRIS